MGCLISFFDIFLIFFTVLAGVFDLTQRRIPNWLILFGLLVGFLLHLAGGVSQLLESVAGFVVGILLFFLPFALGWLGAGDVKFMGAIGAVLGVEWIPRVLFYSALAGGLLAAFAIFTKGVNIQFLKRTWRDIKLLLVSRGSVLPEPIAIEEESRASTIPYGVAIGVGTLIAFYCDPQGQWAGF